MDRRADYGKKRPCPLCRIHEGHESNGTSQQYLPKPGSGNSYKASEYIIPISLVLYEGGEAIEDVREIRGDATLRKLSELTGIPSGSAIGDWLRRIGERSGVTTMESINSRLTEDERAIIMQHSILGANLFADKNSDFDEVSAEVALNHHERWDGKGYPGYISQKEVLTESGTLENARVESGVDIPLYGRITAIADVFDALSSKWCYKQPWSDEEVLREMDANKGSSFDPELIDHFFLCLPVLWQIQARYKDEEH